MSLITPAALRVFTAILALYAVIILACAQDPAPSSTTAPTAPLVLQRRFVEMDGCCFLCAPKALGVAVSKQCLARYNFASMMTDPGKPSL